MAVRGTTNYVYFTDRALGVGATGSVYFGRHKRRGDPCAIKVFRSSDGGGKEFQLRQREFNVMSKLNHENIVKFINIEPESHGSDKVLIMELCTGGSVYKMLEDPENAFGFPEDEFLIFLKDITKALQYLRQNGIVHRDIKPGNILRYIKDDLSSLYKLTDFGAARELPEDEEFMSLYGTEEYLHPDLYARALLGANRFDRYQKSFNASVDLWSLGVTLYHVATGCLPFQPFGGRKNKEVMHLIISRKEPGFISGVQQTKDGSVEWSRELPHTCRLSLGLRRLLVPILVGLLESERRRQWNFETFFRSSNDISSRTLIHIFCAASCSHNRLYLGHEERKSLTHFQESLAETTKIPANRQLLFHERWSVENLIPVGKREPSPIHRTTVECPLFVLPTSYISTEWMMEKCSLPKAPVPPPSVDMSEDAAFARGTCAYAMYLHDRTTQLCRAQDSLLVCANRLGNLLETSLQELQLPFHSLLPFYEKLSKLHALGVALFGQKETQLRQLKENFEEVKNILTKLSNDLSPRSSSLTEFLRTFSTKMCQPSSSCTRRQGHLVQELEMIKNAFKEHKKKEKDMSYNEQQIHKFDRGRASDGAKKSLEIYTMHCSVNTEAVWNTFISYHSKYSQIKTEIDRGESLLRDIHHQLTNVEERLIEVIIQRDKNRTGKTDDVTRTDTSNKDDQPSWSRANDDSAFINDFNTNSVPTESKELDDRRTRHGIFEGHFLPQGLQKCSETIPEEDSGIESLAGILKETLKENNHSLKISVSKSDETEHLIQKLCSLFPVSFKS